MLQTVWQLGHFKVQPRALFLATTPEASFKASRWFKPSCQALKQAGQVCTEGIDLKTHCNGCVSCSVHASLYIVETNSLTIYMYNVYVKLIKFLISVRNLLVT